jgi:hypothetical protein
MSDEQYARHLVLRRSARKRESEEARQIGEIIEKLFDEWRAGYRLKGITKRGFEPGWRALIEYHSPVSGWRFFDIPIPTEDFSGEGGESVIDATNPEELRRYLGVKLGRDEIRTVAS